MKKFTKILGLIMTVIMMVSLLAACGGDKGGEVDENVEKAVGMTAEEYAAMSVDELIAKTIGEEKEVSNEGYIKLFSTYKFAELEEDFYISHENKTSQALKKLKEDKTVTLPSSTTPEILSALLTHESALVRGEAVNEMSGNLLGTTDESKKVVTDLITKETEPYVLTQMLTVFANDSDTPEIGQFMLKTAEHENPFVREAAARALANSWSKDLEGVVDAVIKLMNDKEDDVRKAALSGGGKLGDEKVIDTVVAILNNPDDYNVHGEAIKCLSTLWFDYPFHENTNEKAYRATLDYISKSTMTENVPQWTSFSAFNTITTDEKIWNAWKAKATYYNQDELATALMTVVVNPDANWLARTGAVKALSTHTTPEKYLGYQATIDGLSDEKASFVQDEYERGKK